MIYIDINRQRLSKNWANICRFVLSTWGNYRKLTVLVFKTDLRLIINRLYVLITQNMCFLTHFDTDFKIECFITQIKKVQIKILNKKKSFLLEF